MDYQFIEAGSQVQYKEHKLFLDVGNSLEKGIIDHHQLINIKKSATRLVFENKQYIPDDLHIIVVHKIPDLDCIASSFLAKYYYDNNYFPKYAKELCDFIDKVDFGYKPENIVSLSSIFSIIKSQCQSDLEIINKGHELINDLSTYGFDSGNVAKKYSSYIKQLMEDDKLFEIDLINSSVKEFLLEDRNNKKVKTKGLVLYHPRSLLFKDWARAIGYDLLIVKWSERRTVISVKADGYLSLKKVGNKLNKSETEKRKKLKIKIDEENREGYSIPDPWYDGRAHNYTIVDAPNSGTLLTLEEILDCINFKK